MQRRITVYLDRETSEIDRLITAKERLMTLLAEKRCGLLTHAVTRGFSNGPIKDSNFAWIGDIPSHWTIERLKSHIKSIVQGWSPQCDSFPANDDEWGVLKVGAVNGWMFDSSEQKRLPTDLDPILDYEVKPGDILMSRANTTELVGRVVIVEQVRPRLMFCDKHYRIEIDETRLDARFLFYFLRSPTGHFEFEVAASGASNSMQNISQEAVRNVWVTIPPIKEQVEIVKTVSDGFKRIEELEFRTLESIRLLHERRAALISAAVTGELEVL